MKYTCLTILLFICCHVSAQQKLPVIRANSKTISIRDGAFLDKGTWSLNPAEKPDVYTADRTRKTKFVTFYTDVDSIRVKVKPGSRFDFVVLYKGVDSCYTRIESAIPPKDTVRADAKPDTIPFILTSHNAIAVKAVLDGKDTLNIHFDLSAYGFRLTKKAILEKTTLLPNRADVLNGKATANYRRLNKVHTLQLGTRTWHEPSIGATELTAHDMDGRLGWDVFDGLVVELNYEKGILVIHPGLPPDLKGYKRSRLHFIRSFPCAEGTMIGNGQKYMSNFVMDTGSDQSLIIDSLWAVQSHFPTNLETISTTTLYDPRGKSYVSRKVAIPAIQLNQFTTTKVPALLLGNQNPVGFPVNYLGNGLLKHYDLVADFQKDELYLRENNR
ncbi:MAG: hypothetical protein ACHQHN_01450 [Sphingobacteriales bacterium]